VGTGLYLNRLADSIAQWQRVRQPSALGNQALGVCGYSFATPSVEGASRRAFVNAVATQSFGQSANVPAMPWKDTPAKGHLMGTLVQPSACLDLDGYPVSLTGPGPDDPRTLLTDGQGWFGTVDLQPGQYTLTVELAQPGTAAVPALRKVRSPVTVYAGSVTDLQIALPGCSVQVTYLPLMLR
jgi:hypothetical protein